MNCEITKLHTDEHHLLAQHTCKLTARDGLESLRGFKDTAGGGKHGMVRSRARKYVKAHDKKPVVVALNLLWLRTTNAEETPLEVNCSHLLMCPRRIVEDVAVCVFCSFEYMLLLLGSGMHFLSALAQAASRIVNRTYLRQFSSSGKKDWCTCHDKHGFSWAVGTLEKSRT